MLFRSLAPEPDEPQRLPPAAERGAAAVYALDDSQFLNGAQAQALVRVIEAAPHVKRRYHFFVWMQSHVHVLLPHLVAICGAYERQRRELVYEAFHSVPLPPTLLQSLADPQSAWIAELGRAWVAGQSHALVLSLAETALLCTLPESRALIAAGLSHIAVHGVARPQRPDEIE